MSRRTEEIVASIWRRNWRKHYGDNKLDAGYRTCSLRWSDISSWMRSNRPKEYDETVREIDKSHAIRKPDKSTIGEFERIEQGSISMEDLPKKFLLNGIEVNVFLNKPGLLGSYDKLRHVTIGFFFKNAETEILMNHHITTEGSPTKFEEVPATVYDVINATMKAVYWNFPVEPLTELVTS